MMDSDAVVMDDPYKYFKHPPFKDITVLNQAENAENPNGGLLYVQNAAPDGPAAFMFAGVAAILPAALCQLLCIAYIPLSPSCTGLGQGEASVGHELHAQLCLIAYFTTSVSFSVSTFQVISQMHLYLCICLHACTCEHC